MRQKLAAGNWKMNGTSELLSEIQELVTVAPFSQTDVLICPPATLLERVSNIVNGNFSTGGQDCHMDENGAHTGDISGEMLRDAGASYVIVGHSERRQDHHESDLIVRQKASAAISAELISIICLGENLEQREAGNALAIISEQLANSVPETATGENVVIAYEPVWAIGTGKVATLDQIEEAHTFIRNQLAERFGTLPANAFRILYGGSVKASNAIEIFSVPNVDGALVGGASLRASDFIPIIDALERV